MKRVTNTKKEAEDNPITGMIKGLNIEAQEAAGQRELVNSSQLPAKHNAGGGRMQDAKPIYEKLGIKVIQQSEGDDLFYDVELPKGWKLQDTDHAMWNKLLDHHGKEIGAIFYKAAFYDRDAFINFTENSKK